MNSVRQNINWIFGVALIGSMSYCTYNFASAENRVRNLCSEIQPGMTVNAVRDFALAHGLGPAPHESGVNFLVESKTFGRYGCKINVEAGLVKVVEYNFSD